VIWSMFVHKYIHTYVCVYIVVWRGTRDVCATLLATFANKRCTLICERIGTCQGRFCDVVVVVVLVAVVGLLVCLLYK